MGLAVRRRKMSYNYRLSTDPTITPHSYEVGIWPDGADTADPSAYLVAEVVWGQETAAARASFYNANPAMTREDTHAREQSHTR